MDTQMLGEDVKVGMDIEGEEVIASEEELDKVSLPHCC